MHAPPRNTNKGRACHPSHPSGPTPGLAPTFAPYKEPARPSRGKSSRSCFCSCPPAAPGPRQSRAWISCLPSGQFLLIKEQEPRLVSRSHPHLPRARGSFHWACVSLFFQADSLRAFRDCDRFHQHLSFCRIRLGLEETLNPLAPSEIKHKEDF